MVESGSPFCPSALPSDGTLQEKNAPREKSSTVLLLLPLFLDPLGEEVPQHLLLVVPELAPPFLGAVCAEPLHVGPAGVGTGQEGHAALQLRVEKTNEIFSGVLHTGTSVSRLPPSLLLCLQVGGVRIRGGHNIKHSSPPSRVCSTTVQQRTCVLVSCVCGRVERVGLCRYETPGQDQDKVQVDLGCCLVHRHYMDICWVVWIYSYIARLGCNDEIMAG